MKDKNRKALIHKFRLLEDNKWYVLFFPKIFIQKNGQEHEIVENFDGYEQARKFAVKYVLAKNIIKSI